MMKKYSKRLFSALMVTLLLGGTLVNSIGAYAETVSTEPKTGESTGGEAPKPSNVEKGTSLPSLQDNLPKLADPSVPEQPKVESPTEAPKTEEPNMDSKAASEENNESEETGKFLELPALSNLVTPLLPYDVLVRGHWGSSAWELRKDGTLYIDRGNFSDPVSLMDKYFNNGKTWNTDGRWKNVLMKPDIESVTKIIIMDPVVLPSLSDNFFGEFPNLVEIAGAAYLDTSFVNVADRMFANPKLTKVDLSHFDTSKFFSMEEMFKGTSSLTDIGSAHFDTTGANSINGMFDGSGLTKLDLTGFKGKFTTDVDAFANMSNLKEITVGPDTKVSLTSKLGNTIPSGNYWFLNQDTKKEKLSGEMLINEINSGIFHELTTLTLTNDVEIPRIKVHDSTIHEREAINLVENIDWINPSGPGPLTTSQSAIKNAYEDGWISIDSTGFDANKPGIYTVNYQYEYIDDYTNLSYYETASATITVLPAKEISLQIGVSYEDRNEIFSVTGKERIPLDLYKEAKINPYLYHISRIKGENVSYEDDPGGKTGSLVYTPTSGTNRIAILVVANNPIDIQTNSLTYNLGQSNPGNLEAAIKSITASRNVGPIQIQGESESTLNYPAKYDQTPDIDVKTDPNKKVEASVDPATFDIAVRTVGPKTLPVKVTIKSSKPDGAEMIDYEQTVDVPITVQLGNVLYINGIYLVSDWNSSPDTFYTIGLKVRPGTDYLLHTPSNTSTYFSVGYYSGSFSSESISLNTMPSNFVDVAGNRSETYAVQALGTHAFNKRDTNIIQVYQFEFPSFPNTFKVITNNASAQVLNVVKPALINKTTFFEMTESGYKLLTLNQLTPKNGQSIFLNASHAYLDAHVKDFIDSDKYPGLTVSWSEYPNTSIEGATLGKLQVTQKSSTGKDLTYEYSMHINVVPGATTLIVPDKVEFPDITIDGQEKEVPTKPGFEVKMRDTHVNQQAVHYRLSISMQNPFESLVPYLYLKDTYGFIDTPAVNGYTQTFTYGRFNEEMGEPVETTLLSTGLSDDYEASFVLKIPANTPLKAKQYNATITWDLAEVP